MKDPKTAVALASARVACRRQKEPGKRQSIPQYVTFSVNSLASRLQENVLGRIQSLRTRDTSIDVSQVLNITSRDRLTAPLKPSDLPQRLIKHCAANWTNPERQSRACLRYWPWTHILDFSERIHPDKSER